MSKKTQTVVSKFLRDWSEMDAAGAVQGKACAEVADTTDLPKTRQTLQALLERVYRKGFCAAVNQFAHLAGG